MPPTQTSPSRCQRHQRHHQPANQFVGRNERIDDGQCSACYGTKHRHRRCLCQFQYHLLMTKAPRLAGPVRIKRGAGVVKTTPLFNCMRRLAQLIRDLFGVDCSETEALRRLLRNDLMARRRGKWGESDGSLIRKMPSRPLLAIRVAVTDLIAYCKIAILRRRA